MITTESYGCDKHGEDAYQGCAMCDLETLRERLHEAELVAASWKREAELNEQAANESSAYAKRLAEAEKERDFAVAGVNVVERRRDELKARLAEAEALREERALIIQRAENAEAALVEMQTELDAACRGHDAAHAACVDYDAKLAAAEALLREINETVRRADLYNGGAVENGLWTLPARIDAHLARKQGE